MSSRNLSSGWLRKSFLLAMLIAPALLMPGVSAEESVSSRSVQKAALRGSFSPSVKPVERRTRANADLPSKRHSIDIDSVSAARGLQALDAKATEAAAPNQIGVGRSLDIASLNQGRLFMNRDGSKVRALVVSSEGASALRLHFERFSIPEGDEVYVYGTAQDSHVAGPYVRQGPFGPAKEGSGGDFWTDSIEGDTFIVEHYMKGEETELYISEVSHMFADLSGGDFVTQVLSCHNDAMCSSDAEKDAVGRIIYVKNASSFVCTGTILNNVMTDFAPYFYTANHCVSDQNVAQTVQAFWFYRTTGCNSGVVGNSWAQTATGASLLATEQTADSSLLRLFNSLPPSLMYSGWDATAKLLGTQVFGISHPGGGLPPSTTSYLRRASGTIILTNDSCGPSGLVNGYRADWTSGLVEPGSSGSGLFFTSGGQNFLIGVLSCGPVVPTCADLALYGKLSDFFPKIQTYLQQGDSGGSCAPSAINADQLLNGSLAATDCKSRVRGVSHNSDRYSFTGTAGQQVAITLDSSDLDPYVYLIGPDKTIVAQNDDGGAGTNSRIPATSGFITLPSTGTYVIEASSFDPGSAGAYSIGLLGAAAVHTLTVASSSPASGVNITVSPNDIDGFGSGTTEFIRTYNNGTPVMLTAPASAGGNTFVKWQRDGVDFTTNLIANVVVDSSFNMKAVYASGGSGNDTAGLYDPTTARFFLRNLNSAGSADLSFVYGPAGAGWIPVVGDWNGDGIDTVGLLNPATNQFFLKNTNGGGAADIVFAYGPAGAGWAALAGDWNGDGVDAVGLYNPSTSQFFLKNTNGGGAADIVFTYGPAGAGWIPIVGDWDGDGTDSIGLFNPATNTFFLNNTNAGGAADLVFSYGPAGAGWIPVVGDWNGDGVDTVGLLNPATSQFFLKNTNAAGASDLVFSYGPAGAGWTAIVGNWDGL